MKTSKLILFFLVSGLVFLMTCKKVVKEMMVTTGSVTEITVTTAKVTGQVLDLGEGATICGHCYATTANPTVSGTKTELDNPVVGKYVSNLTGLSPATKYYVRAYLSRGSEVVYGSDSSFTTLSDAPPVLTTTAVTDILQTTAISGGNITSQGGSSVTARGVCWSLATAPTIALTTKTSDGPGTGSFSSSLTGLTAGTKYYVRAYATNSGNTGYGNEVSFTTTSAAQPATVITASVNSITSNSAICGGDVTNEGGSSVTVKGVCWSTTANPTTSNFHTENGTGPGSFVSNLTGLDFATEYHVRAYATNGIGTSYATNEIKFTTLSTVPGAPIIGTGTAGDTQATVTFTAPASNGGSPITGYTVMSSPSGLIGTGSSSPIIVTGLTNGTAYTFTVTANNVNGTGPASSASNSVIPLPAGTVINPTTGKIWMDRNLGASEVATSSTDAASYGDLYQWGRFTDGHQIRTSNTTTTLSSSNIPGHGNFILVSTSPYDWRSPQADYLWQGPWNNPCPTGYRLPTDVEWNAERLSWSTNNTAGAFASPLKLPLAGFRYYGDGSFIGVGSTGYYWSSTVDGTISRYLYFDGSYASVSSNRRALGHSVRCIKD
jgi:uncharacterized protein (TIGR02145 family)